MEKISRAVMDIANVMLLSLNFLGLVVRMLLLGSIRPISFIVIIKQMLGRKLCWPHSTGRVMHLFGSRILRRLLCSPVGRFLLKAL